MKKIVLLISSSCIFSLSCTTEERVDQPESHHFIGPMLKTVSIDGFKNGKPFVNYLGEKIDGC